MHVTHYVRARKNGEKSVTLYSVSPDLLLCPSIITAATRSRIYKHMTFFFF